MTLNSRISVAQTEADFEPRLLGFWMFLMSDALIFALLFAIYATQIHALDAGPSGKQIFELGPLIVETMLLLFSSFTFGMATLMLKYRPQHNTRLALWLIATLLLGVGFLALELRDFVTLAGKGATPQASGFLSAYYVLISTHGVHVSAGCLWLVLMLVQLRMFGRHPVVTLRLRCLALFWHFLDVVWVAIYGVVYLQGLMG
jgi:cytochrome o ubiquinol oxidase subunit 3